MARVDNEVLSCTLWICYMYMYISRDHNICVDAKLRRLTCYAQALKNVQTSLHDCHATHANAPESSGSMDAQ